MMQSQMVWFPAAGCSKLVLSGKSFVLTSIVSVIGCNDRNFRNKTDCSQTLSPYLP